MNNKFSQQKNIAPNTALRDVVIGLSDGLTVPFALAAGLSAAIDSASVIVVAGLVAMIAGAITMGIGGYFTVSEAGANSDLHHHETRAESKAAIHHTQEFYANLGLNEELQQQASAEVMRDKQQWTEMISEYEPPHDDTQKRQAGRSAFIIAASYIVGGLVPLSPYFFLHVPIEALKVSAACTLTALFLFGFFKSKMTGANPWAGGLRLMMIGALAAAAAFGVAKIFE